MSPTAIPPVSEGNDMLYVMAQECVTESKNDREEALKLFLKLIEDVPKLQQKLIRLACWNLICQTTREMNRQITTPERARGIAKRAGLKGGLVAMGEHNWFYFSLPNGKRLGEATKADLEEAANFHSQNAIGHEHKAKWFGKLSELLGPKDLVKHRLTQDEIATWYEKSRP